MTHRILLLGSGGREHVLAWKIAQSEHCDTLWIAPGNGGTGALGQNVALDPMDFEQVADFSIEHEVTMLVVGPEAPLVAGIVDHFGNHPALQSVMCIGPDKEGAMLEGSKSFAKIFMQELNIPTAAYRQFTADQIDSGVQYINEQQLPVVLKADGLAAGKGVVICHDHDQAVDEFKAMLSGKFGSAGTTVVVEQFLDGIEFSVFALTDGQNYQLLPVAKDYKRIGEGDTGLNTGGMGSVSPVPFVDDQLMTKVVDRIVEPTIRGIGRRGMNYRGFVFFGLISVDGDPFVIEYNCRMGDPETQVVIPRISSDFVALLDAMHSGGLGEMTVERDPRFAAAVVAVSGGYPEAYAKGKAIHLPEIPDGSILFHAGTKENNGVLVTNGGRVCAVTSLHARMQDAVQQSLDVTDRIAFDGKYFRRDIGFDL